MFKSHAQQALEYIIANADEFDPEMVKQARASLARVANVPVERHHHTLILTKMANGEIRRDKDQYRIERVLSPPEEQVIVGRFAALSADHDALAEARLIEDVRAETGWSNSDFARHLGGADGSPEMLYWRNRIISALIIAERSGLTVTLRPNSRKWAIDYNISQLSSDVLEQVWVALRNREVRTVTELLVKVRQLTED